MRAIVRRVIKHIAIAALMITLVSCRKTARPPAEGGDSPENQATLAKLERYGECLREHSERVFQVADRYRDRVAATPSANVPVHATNDPVDCVIELAVARALPPSLPVLEAAGNDFARALGTTFTLTSTYDPAKAAALSPPLLEAFAEFDRAQGALSDEVRRLNSRVRVDQLAQREKKTGRTILFLIDKVMFHAEELVRRAAIRSDRLDRLDLGALATELAAFEDVVDELHARALANPAETVKDVADLSIISAAIKTFAIAARQLVTRARDKIPYSEADAIMIKANNEESVIGTPGALISAYNRLINSYLFQ